MEGKPSKASFFGALEQLDRPDDPRDDYEDSLDRLFAAAKSSEYMNTTTAPIPVHAAPTKPSMAPRANSDPQGLSKVKDMKREKNSSNYVQSSKSSNTAPSSMRGIKRSQTTGAIVSAKVGSLISKRKKQANSIKRVPEEQQIFKNLVFCKWSVML